MADRVRHQLVDGQRQAPAPLRFHRQRVDRQQKVDVHAVQLAPAHGQAKLAKLFAGVDERVAVGHGQNAVDLDMLVKQIDDVAQLFLGLDVVRPDCLEGDKVDDGGELVLDAMVQLVQKGSSLQGGRMGDGMGQVALLINIKLYRIVYFTCTLIENVSSRHCQRAWALAAS